MRILSVHNRYQVRGGEDECFEAEVSLLREMGHSVDVLDEDNDRVTAIGTVQTAIRTIWSQEIYRAAQQHFRQQSYDVMHVHNFFPLISPAIYYAAQASKIPVVQTLHNYRLLCPSAQFFRENRPCEDCLDKPVALPGIQHGCYRGRAATGVIATMLAGHRLMQTWTKQVDIYITLTEFARQKFIQGGLPAEKLVMKPNFVHPDPGIGTGQGGYAIFVGRLSPEKGIDLLLRAWRQLGEKIPLKILGNGPLADQVKAASETIPGIEWLGRRSLQEVGQFLGEASFLIFPSEWYEGLPRTIIESFAVGTPVIASNLGSMSSLIQPHQNGLHFIPSDENSLVAQVEWTISHPEALQRMRQRARAEYEQKYTAKANYNQLMEIYHLAQLRNPSDSFCTL